MRKISLFFAFAFFSAFCYSQPWFSRVDSVVVTSTNDTMAFPWAGGLNFCQFSAIDMNMDGIKDLMVFDRTGNKIRTFINNGKPNVPDYKYDPTYELLFPSLHDWVLLVDYNCDGKEDIFTYSFAGMSVYKNTSTSTNLQFSLLVYQLKSDYNPNVHNLFISSIDIPAITDVDNDGDIDVLTFQNNGLYVEYHKNLSKELYGICDSLHFLVTNNCWGYFYENALSNHVLLHDTCQGNVPNPEKQNTAFESLAISPNRHSGSSLLALDMDNDGDKELVLGDVAFNSLTLLTNGGSTSASNMVAQDANFPSNTTPVNISIFPAAFYLDVNNDGAKDLLVSPNIQNASQNYTSVWHYKNIGNMNAPVFSFEQNNFLQNEMIDVGEGAYPVFFDYNADGKLDLLVSNYGYFVSSSGYSSSFTLFENIGNTNNPQYNLMTRNYSNINSYSLSNAFPTFGDIDGDGDKDMVIGDADGKLHYFENTAGVGNAANFVLNAANYQSIDVGSFATPQLVDINRDNLLDILIGERSGNLNYYQNVGTSSSPLFSLVTQQFGAVQVNGGSVVGFSAPFLFDYNGSYKLLVGSEKGGLYFYENIDGNLAGNFSKVDSAYQQILVGTKTAPSLADINNDGKIDLVVGNYAGGVSLFYGQNSNSINNSKDERAPITVYPNPANDFVDVAIEKMNTRCWLFLYNTLGEIVSKTEVLSSQIKIDVSQYPCGLYYLSMQNTETNSVSKGCKLLIAR